MLVRCSHCGYQNNEHYRFCGMCGALLRLPDAGHSAHGPEAPTTPARTQTAKPASAPARNLDYLLEDEPEDHGHHRRMYLALVLLAIAGVVLLWQFSRGRELGLQPSAVKAQPEAVPATGSAPVATAATADSVPSVKDQSSKNDAQTLEPAKASEHETASSPPPGKQAPVLKADEKPAVPTADQAQQPDTPDKPAPQPATEQISTKDAGTDPAPASLSKTNSAKPVAAKPVAPPRAASAAPQAAPGSADETLVASGEKYLYGNGVAENCALAQKNLRAAAQHSNARAQSILGTMYATGHCVDRDLPMAYRWFAKALHQDPANNRIQRDLEVLWRQMTADERQLAIRQ